MLAHELTLTASIDGDAAVAYDLVVIGSGLAGLNSLYAATYYLPKSARVLLIDQMPMAGGMWNTTYDYVELHLPHQMFTVDDMRWEWKQPREYRAKRDEIRDHLGDALRLISTHVRLETCFGHTVTACDEVRTDSGYLAQIVFYPNNAPEKLTLVEAKRAIYASGANIPVPRPLKLASKDVISIVPQNLREVLAANPLAPVFVVGGGKTGMDTILATLAEDPQRMVSLISGRGTIFLNRTKLYPIGLKRWTSGTLNSRMVRDVVLNFNGGNEDHTVAYLRRHYSTKPKSSDEQCFFGFQSEEELRQIAEGLSATYVDYMVDVITSADGPILKMRGGTDIPIERGSIFVNCTGSALRIRDNANDRPCVTPHDTVASINTRNGFHVMSGVAGFNVTHLFYRSALRGRGFWTLDYEALFHQNRNACFSAAIAQSYSNQLLAMKILPITISLRCPLNLDRWYPFPRRMAGQIALLLGAASDIRHCHAALERVAKRFSVHCARLE